MCGGGGEGSGERRGEGAWERGRSGGGGAGGEEEGGGDWGEGEEGGGRGGGGRRVVDSPPKPPTIPGHASMSCPTLAFISAKMMSMPLGGACTFSASR